MFKHTKTISRKKIKNTNRIKQIDFTTHYLERVTTNGIWYKFRVPENLAKELLDELKKHSERFFLSSKKYGKYCHVCYTRDCQMNNWYECNGHNTDSINTKHTSIVGKRYSNKIFYKILFGYYWGYSGLDTPFIVNVQTERLYQIADTDTDYIGYTKLSNGEQEKCHRVDAGPFVIPTNVKEFIKNLII